MRVSFYRTRQRGVTLVELLMAFVLLSVLVALAAPSFAQLQRETALTSQANQLFAAFQRIRAEAIKRRCPVTACPSTDLAVCDTAANWHDGWILFEDHNGNTSRDANEPLLEVQSALAAGPVMISAGTTVKHFVSYRPSGRAETAAGFIQVGTITLCRAGSARKLILNSAGRVRVVRDDC